MASPLRVVGGWAGVLAPVVYVTAWAVLGATRPGYDPVAQAISELGEVGAATAPGMSLGFVLFGVAALPFAVALHRTLPGDTRPAAIAAVVCGVMTVGAAVFPCSPGCPGAGSSATDTGHSITAVTGYLALMATPLLAGWALWDAGRTSTSYACTSGAWRPFAWWSLLAGGCSAVLMLLWALGWFGGAGGAAQRGFNTLADVWWVTAGVAVLRPPGPSGAHDDDG